MMGTPTPLSPRARVVRDVVFIGGIVAVVCTVANLFVMDYSDELDRINSVNRLKTVQYDFNHLRDEIGQPLAVVQDLQGEPESWRVAAWRSSDRAAPDQPDDAPPPLGTSRCESRVATDIVAVVRREPNGDERVVGFARLNHQCVPWTSDADIYVTDDVIEMPSGSVPTEQLAGAYAVTVNTGLVFRIEEVGPRRLLAQFEVFDRP